MSVDDNLQLATTLKDIQQKSFALIQLQSGYSNEDCMALKEIVYFEPLEHGLTEKRGKNGSAVFHNR